MKRFSLLSAALCACAAVALVFSAGCESAEANDVRISPGHAEVSKGGMVGLTASGWDNFRWTLSDDSIGTLSATVGRSVVYTATGSGEGTQRVTATAIGAGVSSGGSTSSNATQTASVGFSATAVITHK